MNGSIEKLDDTKYDLIILSHVLEHITYPLEFLKKLKSSLSDCGVLYIEVPSLELIKNGGYSYNLDNYWQFPHTIHFTVKSLSALCNKAGLKVSRYTDYIQSCWTKSEILNDFDFKYIKNYNENLLDQIEINKNSIFSFIKIKNFIKRKLVFIITLVGLRSKATYFYYKFIK